jgi:hypothetical protein
MLLLSGLLALSIGETGRVVKCRNADCTEPISVVRALQSYTGPGERITTSVSAPVPYPNRVLVGHQYAVFGLSAGSCGLLVMGDGVRGVEWTPSCGYTVAHLECHAYLSCSARGGGEECSIQDPTSLRGDPASRLRCWFNP